MVVKRGIVEYKRATCKYANEECRNKLKLSRSISCASILNRVVARSTRSVQNYFSTLVHAKNQELSFIFIGD